MPVDVDGLLVYAGRVKRANDELTASICALENALTASDKLGLLHEAIIELASLIGEDVMRLHIPDRSIDECEVIKADLAARFKTQEQNVPGMNEGW